MANKFHERFGIELGVKEAKQRFVNRTLNFVLDEIIPMADSVGYDEQERLERYICSKLGERFAGRCCLENTIHADFDNCLRILEALYEHPEWKIQAEMRIRGLLNETEIDIGIRWENGHFLPAGAPALDNALVNDPLNLLNAPEYKGVSDPFRKGLDHFLHSTKNKNLLADVLTDMYEALEAMAKIVCPNGKDRLPEWKRSGSLSQS